MPDSTSIAEELDAMHHRAMDHYRQTNLGAYRQLFAPDLKYRQMNGTEIDRDQLARDVRAQFSRVTSADSSYTRESLSIESERATEQVVEVASTTIRVFVFFRRTWQVRRTGRYTWVKGADGWKIHRVAVLNEHITARSGPLSASRS